MTNRIEGKEFVFTGRIRIPRHEAWGIVSRCGGSFSTYVRNSTDYAVVGGAPGQKAFIAQEKGTAILSESDFFSWVDEAESERIPEPESAPETPKEPEEPPVPIEDWIKGATCFICEECDRAFAVHLKEGEDPKCPLCSNKWDDSHMSYRNPEALAKVLSENPDMKLAPPMNCPGCGVNIPYSISPINPLRYYCWNCRHYYTRIDHTVTFEDKNGTIFEYEPGWIVGLVKDCADLYTLTKQLLKGGLDWAPVGEPSPDTITLMNERGKVAVLNTDEIVRTEEHLKNRDVCNSAEFWAPVLQGTKAYRSKTQNTAVYTTPDADPELYSAYLADKERKTARRQDARQRRFDKRQDRLLGTKSITKEEDSNGT